MLNSNYVVNKIQDALNNSPLFFMIYEFSGHWFDYSLKSKDGQDAIVGVIETSPTPMVGNNYETRTFEYIVSIRGLDKYRVEVENIVNSIGMFKEDNFTFTFGSLNIIDRERANNGYLQETDFYGNFRVKIDMPFALTGNDIKISIDDVLLQESYFVGEFDKSLISSKSLEGHDSPIATSENYRINIPITNNEKIIEILTSAISFQYNKKFTLKIDFGFLTKTLDVVLRKGVLAYSKDNEAVEFSVSFERPLPRKVIQINYQDVETTSFQVDAIVNYDLEQVNNEMKTKPIAKQKKIIATLINDGSSVINDIIDVGLSNVLFENYEITYTEGGEERTEFYYITYLSLSSLEHPTPVVRVEFGQR